jgi:hypothetical protein
MQTVYEYERNQYVQTQFTENNSQGYDIMSHYVTHVVHICLIIMFLYTKYTSQQFKFTRIHLHK